MNKNKHPKQKPFDKSKQMQKEHAKHTKSKDDCYYCALGLLEFPPKQT